MSRMVCVGTVPIGELVIIHSYRGEQIATVNGRTEFGDVEIQMEANYNIKRPYVLIFAASDLVEVD